MNDDEPLSTFQRKWRAQGCLGQRVKGHERRAEFPYLRALGGSLSTSQHIAALRQLLVRALGLHQPWEAGMPCSYDLGTQGCLFRLVLASPCLEKVNLGLSPLHCPHETAGTFLHLQPSPICALMSPKGEKGRFMCTGFEREWLSCAELHPCIEMGP